MFPHQVVESVVRANERLDPRVCYGYLNWYVDRVSGRYMCVGI